MLWYVCCFFQAPFRSKSIRVICIPWSSSSLYIWNLWLSGKHDRPLVPNNIWTGRWGYRNYQDCNQLFFSNSLCWEIYLKFGLKPKHPSRRCLSCYTVDVFALPYFFTRKIMENSTLPGSLSLRVSLPVKIPAKNGMRPPWDWKTGPPP